MTDLYRPPFPEFASLDSKSAREFYSLRTCTSSNVEKAAFRSITYVRYEANCISLAWYSPMTCPITSNESLFTNKLQVSYSLASNIPTIKASYSAWLFLALKANLGACSINNLLGPSKMTPTPLLCWLDDPFTERTHWKSLGLGWGPSYDNSTMKSAYTWPLGSRSSYYTSNSDNSTTQPTIRPVMSSC